MKRYIIKSINVPVKQAYEEGLKIALQDKIEKVLRTKDFKFEGILKKSLDARRKSNIKFVISALVTADKSFNLKKLKDVSEYEEFVYDDINIGSKSLKKRPVVVGSGPSGLFCAYLLASYGYKPIILERGSDIDTRKKTVEHFWRTGQLNADTNVQFGEGGAGTFSDGKLVTRINNSRCTFVLETFHKYGAKDDILYESKPHIGTDYLMTIIKRMRKEIEKMGGTFEFNAKVTSINIDSNKVNSIEVNNKYEIETDVLVLAIGHSARDTYEMLYEKGITMIQKPFSMGVRIEHLQEDVDYAQFGKSKKYINDPAEYYLHAKYMDRTAYSFCMCPGGTVINAASEEGGLTTNGMSNSDRSGKNSNSAWVVSVKPEDFKSKHPLAGIELQRDIERKTFIAGKKSYAAPVQRLEDFLRGEPSKKFGVVKPSFTGQTVFSDLSNILPTYIYNVMKNTVSSLNNRLKCFGMGDALLTGCETRTSAPVRITRDERFNAIGITGLYPAGEGAGYAGGITSASVDGLRVAEKIIETYNYID